MGYGRLVAATTMLIWWQPQLQGTDLVMTVVAGAAKLINGHQTSRYFAFINFLYIYNKNIHNWVPKR
jgi:hypothetical protein